MQEGVARDRDPAHARVRSGEHDHPGWADHALVGEGDVAAVEDVIDDLDVREVLPNRPRRLAALGPSQGESLPSDHVDRRLLERVVPGGVHAGKAEPTNDDVRALDQQQLVERVQSRALRASPTYGAAGRFCGSTSSRAISVFFADASHVGIYLGGNRIIDAPHTGAVVHITTMDGWYGYEYDGARRVAAGA